MDLLKKINWKQPKYMLPLIAYVPLLFTGYFIIDLFHTEKAEIPDGSLATTEYLNPDLPDAQMKGDGIGSKYESMLKSYGKIDDYSAMENIDRNEDDAKESYDSKYSDEERQLLEAQETAKLADLERQLQESAQKGKEIADGQGMTEADRLALSQQREQEAMQELERALAININTINNGTLQGVVHHTIVIEECHCFGNGSGCQPNQSGRSEVVEYLFPISINRAVTFVNDYQIEKIWGQGQFSRKFYFVCCCVFIIIVCVCNIFTFQQ